jgi:hypothetical protein
VQPRAAADSLQHFEQIRRLNRRNGFVTHSSATATNVLISASRSARRFAPGSIPSATLCGAVVAFLARAFHGNVGVRAEDQQIAYL